MLTFEEWRHTYADVFETDDAARAAWTAASNKGYSAGVQDTRELLAAHNAGAQGEPIPGSPAFSLRGLYKPAQEYFIDGKPATPEEYIDWQSRIIEAVTKAKLPDPKYYGTQDEDGNEHDVKCAYVDGWNQCRASILEVKPLAQMPLDDERNAFEAWAASKGHRFNDGDLNHCKSWALSAWLRRAEIAGAHPQPMTDSAGAQGEPYGWIGFDNDSGLNAAFSLGPAKPESWTYYFPLYAHPQPITDAARDAKRYQAIRAKVLPFNAYASGNPNWTFPDYGPRGATFDEAIDAEIERLDRSKGE